MIHNGFIKKELCEMKICEGYEVKKIAGDFLIIPYGQKIVEKKQIIKLNQNSGLLLDYIKNNECTMDELVSYVEREIDNFSLGNNVDEQIRDFVYELIAGGILEE